MARTPGSPAGATGGPGSIFFLTDYGRRDELVGVVHAVLARRAPGAPVVDLTHEIPPYDVVAGARALARAVVHLGAGVVLAVVDPGVGGPRRAVAVEAVTGSSPRYWVGPDNGLLLDALGVLGGAAAAVALGSPDPEAFSGPVTFDGRDIFAPAAAALWAGVPLGEVGEPVDPGGLTVLDDPVDRERRTSGGGRVRTAEVLWIDRFGNVQLATRGGDLPLGSSIREVRVGSSTPRPARRVRTFGDLERGEVGLIEDANGRLALVLREADAAALLGASQGDLVVIRWDPP